MRNMLKRGKMSNELDDLTLDIEEISDLAFTIRGKCKQLQEKIYMKKEHKGVTFLDDLQELRRKRDNN